MNLFAEVSSGQFESDYFIAIIFGFTLALVTVPAIAIYLAYKNRAWINKNVYLSLAILAVAITSLLVLLSGAFSDDFLTYFVVFVYLPSLILVWAVAEQFKTKLFEKKKMKKSELNALRVLAFVSGAILLLNFTA